MTVMRVGVLTCGGEVAGLNPCLKAITYRASEAGIKLFGLYDGWEGLLGESSDPPLELVPSLVRTWDQNAGSHLGCSRSNPFRLMRDGQREDASARVMQQIQRDELDALIVLGGSDSALVAHRFSGLGVPVVLVPKSVTGDLAGTDYTLGFDSSLQFCAEMIERSRTPAGAQRWVQIVEVPGRHSGHLALWSGVAGGAQTILIPEVPFELSRVYALLEERLHGATQTAHGAERVPRYATVVVSEGAIPLGGEAVTLDPTPDEFGHSRLGGIGALLAARLRADTNFEARELALGHPQRGGVASSLDRVAAFRFGSAAVDACVRKQFGTMIALRGAVANGELSLVPLQTCARERRCVNVERDYEKQRYFARRAGLLSLPGEP